jgi:hypothetical protein
LDYLVSAVFRTGTEKHLNSNLKIQSVLKREKILQSIKEPMWRKSKPKAKIEKPDYPILKIGVSYFSRTERV